MGASPCVETVGIIGAGRVGSILGAALAAAGYHVVGASGRSAEARARIEEFLPGTPLRRPTDIAGEADLVIFAVPDDALAPMVAHLAESGAFRRASGPDGDRPAQVVAHTSGAHGVGVLHPAVAKGARPLALHPAMTFAGRRADLERLRAGISFGVTAPTDVRPLADTLVRRLGGSPEWITEDRRALYHTALAHGANHLVTLVNDALDRLRDAGVRQPERMLDPLLHAALDNALRMGDAALTGPVSRGDAGTVSRHLEVLADTAPDTLPAYLALARRTADRAIAAGRLGGAEAAPLLDALADAAHRRGDVTGDVLADAAHRRGDVTGGAVDRPDGAPVARTHRPGAVSVNRSGSARLAPREDPGRSASGQSDHGKEVVA